MRAVRVLTLAAVILAVQAAPAAAGTLTWPSTPWTKCGWTACATIQSISYNGTNVELIITNVAQTTNPGSFISNILLTFNPSVNITSIGPTASVQFGNWSGGSFSGFTKTESWAVGVASENPNGISFDQEINDPTSAGSGCNPFNSSTCGRLMYSAKITFALSFDGDLAFTDFAAHVQGLANGQSEWTTCPNGPCSSVPEPVSMVLLGSGLAGVAAIRRRRRGLDIENG